MAHAQKPDFVLSARRTSPFKSAGTLVQLTTGSRGVRISGINAGYTMFRGSVKSTGCPLHSPVSSSLPLPCVTVCRHVSTGLYLIYHVITIPWMYEPKRKVSPVKAMKAYRGIEVWLHTFLTSVLDVGELSIFTPTIPFTPGKEHR